MMKLKMPLRFLTGAVIALAFLWTANASAFYLSFSNHHQSHRVGSDGPSITMSDHFNLSRIHWGSSGSVSPVTTNIGDNPFSEMIHHLLVTRITFSRGGWSSDGPISFVDCYFPPREPNTPPPSNAVPEPQAALLFAIGVGVTSVVRKRRS